MLSVPKQRERAGSIMSIQIPDFDVNALPKTRLTVESDNSELVSESQSSMWDSFSTSDSNPFSRENTQSFSSRNNNMTSYSSAHVVEKVIPLQDKAVLEFKATLARPSMVGGMASSAYKNYDARLTVAVIGSENSGKEVILSKELGLQDHIPVVERNITIMRKMYGGRISTMVEYWICPDSKSFMNKSIKCLSGHAGTIFVFDVTEPNSLIYLAQWIEVMKSSVLSPNQPSPFGFFGVLMANKVDQPGLRVIFEEEAESFAKQHGLEYVETCPSEDERKVNAMFSRITSKASIQIPDSMNRANREQCTIRGTCPIGLQLGLALDPWSKFKYKERLKREKQVPELTKTADWFTHDEDDELSRLQSTSSAFKKSSQSIKIKIEV